MKKIAASLLVIATTFLAFSSAHAQDVPSKVYGELGYARLNAKLTDVTTDKFSPAAFTGFLGYQVTPNIAVEGFLGVGAGAGRIKEDGVKTTDKGQVKNSMGLFLKPSIAVSDSVELFARIGWTRSELEIGSSSGRDNDAAYGFGANFNLSKRTYIQANWMNYYKKDGLKVDGLTVAYGFRF